ncbi:MAG TPA: hypothetical protein VNE21_00860, partial [Mycobacteriales bacterium]|nr:hypothetical protein [Mycobacteriales bacterium]
MTIRPRLPAPSSGMRRTVLRLGTPLAGALGLLLVGTEPAFAQSASGSAPLGFWKTVLIFVVVPLALFGAIG